MGMMMGIRTMMTVETLTGNFDTGRRSAFLRAAPTVDGSMVSTLALSLMDPADLPKLRKGDVVSIDIAIVPREGE